MQGQGQCLTSLCRPTSSLECIVEYIRGEGEAKYKFAASCSLTFDNLNGNTWLVAIQTDIFPIFSSDAVQIKDFFCCCDTILHHSTNPVHNLNTWARLNWMTSQEDLGLEFNSWKTDARQSMRSSRLICVFAPCFCTASERQRQKKVALFTSWKTHLTEIDNRL